MRQAADKTEHWLQYYESRRAGELDPQLDAWNEDVFSYHEYSDTCTKRVLAKVPLEPLVGTLRHPYAICDADEFKCDSNMIICRGATFLLVLRNENDGQRGLGVLQGAKGWGVLHHLPIIRLFFQSSEISPKFRHFGQKLQ
jgi:hypothetical protein